MAATIHRMPLSPEDPVWLNEHEYEVRWKGKLVRVDTRFLKPIAPISNSLIKACTVKFKDLLNGA